MDRVARQVTVLYRLIAKSPTPPRLSKHTCTPKGDQKSIFNVCVYVSVFMLLYFYNFLTLNTVSYLSSLLQFKMHTHTHTHTHTYKYTCTQNRLSCVRLFANLWTIACQAPLSMGFSRHKYWNDLPCPPQGIFSTQG